MRLATGALDVAPRALQASRVATGEDDRGPGRAEPSAVAAPIPELAPVTITGFSRQLPIELAAFTLPPTDDGTDMSDVKPPLGTVSRGTERLVERRQGCRPSTTQTASTVSSPVVVQPVGNGRVEADGVAGPERVVVEADRHVRGVPLMHDPELAAGVADERVGRARLAAGVDTP